MKFKNITINVKDQHVECKLFTPKNDDRKVSVVISHGWTSSDKKYLPLGEMLVEQGISVLVVNLRGHGDSKYQLSDNSRKDHEEDIISAIRYMKETYPENKLALLGKSYSGYLAVIVSSKEDVDFLIMSQPALYPDGDYNIPTSDLIDKDPNIYKQTRGDTASNKALMSLSKFKNPVLFIESECDEEVTKGTTGRYLINKRQNIKNVVLKDADHALTKEEYRDDFYNVVVDWLVKINN